jgi:predicted GIY-YIG superfamily endonuclease
MPDYQQSKIYMIRSESANLTYYGSTTSPLSHRMGQHRETKKRHENGKYHYVTSFKVMEHNDYQITLVEKYPCNDKEELNARERWYIANNECVNKVHPGRTHREYHEDNRETILEKKKIYREENLDKIREKDKIHYEKNKDKIKIKRSISRECSCGVKFINQNKARHERSKHHQNWIEQNV